MQTKLFLQELAKAEKQAGVWLFRQFLSPATASELFETLNSDDGFPWETKPSLYGEKLNQHAYNFKRSCREVTQLIVTRICDACPAIFLSSEHYKVALALLGPSLRYVDEWYVGVIRFAFRLCSLYSAHDDLSLMNSRAYLSSCLFGP